MEEYITPKYETIGVMEMQNIVDICNSTLLRAFTKEDYNDIVSVFARAADRLEKQK